MILSSLFALTQAFGAANLSMLEAGSHCVAYKAQKTMFFVSSSDVIGKNCDISAQVLPEVGGLYHIEVIVPIKSFQSGDESRDADVAKDLKIDLKPELTFKSKAMSVDEWHALFSKGAFDLPGELSVGDKSYPLKVSMEYLQHEDQSEVDGIAKVKFADFEIPPPKVVAGVVAKTKPDLELHFHLLGSRILGADSIRLEPTATSAKSEAKSVEEKK